MSDRIIGLVQSEQNLNLFSPDSALKTVGALGKLGPKHKKKKAPHSEPFQAPTFFDATTKSSKFLLGGFWSEQPEISQAM